MVGVATERRPVERFEVVTYETASRNGEPMKMLATYFNSEGRNAGRPNVTNRMCTAHLKIKARQYYAKSLGWGNDWTNVIGLRADEERRVAKSKDSGDPWDNCWPLHAAGITAHDVVAWWKQQDFDLQLPVDVRGVSAEGNCDLCFLKHPGKKVSIIRVTPCKADWWIAMEEEFGALFRNDQPNYAALKVMAEQPQLFDIDFGEDADTCACTD